MDIAKYLERINYSGNLDITDYVLKELHKRHVCEIPFENLDVYCNKLFDLNIEKVFNKVVNDGRGGFCYELNSLFHWLLTEIGFSNRNYSCSHFQSGRHAWARVRSHGSTC